MLFVSESDGYEFMIVSLDNKQWHFEAQNSDVSKVVCYFFVTFLVIVIKSVIKRRVGVQFSTVHSTTLLSLLEHLFDSNKNSKHKTSWKIIKHNKIIT